MEGKEERRCGEQDDGRYDKRLRDGENTSATTSTPADAGIAIFHRHNLPGPP